MFEKLNSLDDLLLHEVQDMYHAEKQVVKALPDVAEQAASPGSKARSRSICSKPKYM